MSDVIEQLEDLILQATTERSHFYVRAVASAAKQEIERLREKLKTARNAALEEAAVRCEQTVPRHTECQNKIAQAIRELKSK